LKETKKKKKLEFNKKEKNPKEATRGCGHVRCLQSVLHQYKATLQLIKKKKKNFFLKQAKK
jgi:hypothetical protein